MASNGFEDKDVILKYFDNSQQDFRQRVELKQTVLLAYAGATAALVAFIIQQYKDHNNVTYLLLIIPLFSLLTACTFADHMLVTTGIVSFQLKEIHQQLSSHKVPEILHVSDHLNPLQSIFWALQLGQHILIGLPSAGALLAFVVMLGPKWNFLSGMTRLGICAAIVIDCAAFALSYHLLHTVAKNTLIFRLRSKQPKGTSVRRK